MSIAYLLLLLFLCISLHACNARHLSPLDKKKSHFSIKNGEKNGFDFSPKQLNEGIQKMEKEELVGDSEKAKNRRRTSQRVVKVKGIGKGSGALQSESLVSVSWRVPHKKQSQKHPGFNLDYSPPKTHPPSHN
ncbi:hypothetical protein SESBI_43155 [Sesbania bispinosa]|nr:hypothetical protein SESBI_43155 [Sesbania bispinosa]